jgi:hypothetical protein
MQAFGAHTRIINNLAITVSSRKMIFRCTTNGTSGKCFPIDFVAILVLQLVDHGGDFPNTTIDGEI